MSINPNIGNFGAQPLPQTQPGESAGVTDTPPITLAPQDTVSNSSTIQGSFAGDQGIYPAAIGRPYLQKPIPDGSASKTGGVAVANPPGDDGYVPNANTPGGLATNGLQMGQDSIESMLNTLRGMTSSPKAMELIRFLTARSEAISDLQAALQRILGQDAELKTKRATAQYDASTDKAQSQIDAAKEMADKQASADKKQATMDKLGLSGSAVGIIVTVVMILISLPAIIGAGIPAGLIIAAFLIAVLVDQIMKAAGEEKGVFDHMMDGINKMVDGMIDLHEKLWNVTVSDKDRDIAKVAFRLAAVISITAVAIVCCPSAALMAGSAGFMAMTSSANVGGEIAKLAGADENTQNWVEFGVESAVMIAAMAASFKVNTATTQIEKGTGMLSKALDKTSAFIGKTAERAGQLFDKAIDSAGVGFSASVKIEKAAKVITNPNILMTTTQVGLATAKTVTSVRLANLNADIADIQGNAEADAIEMDAIITFLKNAIKQMQESMSGFNDMIATIGESANNSRQGLSNALSYPT